MWDQDLGPRLSAWAQCAPDAEGRRTRAERAIVAFGLGDSEWNEEWALQRFELLYEAGLTPEAFRDRGDPRPSLLDRPGRAMVHDHRRILATGLSRLRAKIKYRPVVFELMPPVFTLLQLQQAVEALAGRTPAQAELSSLGGKPRPDRGNGRDGYRDRRPAGSAGEVSSRGDGPTRQWPARAWRSAAQAETRAPARRVVFQFTMLKTQQRLSGTAYDRLERHVHVVTQGAQSVHMAECRFDRDKFGRADL